MSLKPASMAFVCSICLFWASWNISAERSNLALSCSILFSHISIKELCQSWVVISEISRRLLLPLRPLVSCSFSAFLFSLLFWTPVTSSAGSDSSRETFTLSLCVYTRTPFDCHFRRIDAVAVSHHLIKDVEIGEAFFNLLNSSFSRGASSLL